MKTQIKIIVAILGLSSLLTLGRAQVVPPNTFAISSVAGAKQGTVTSVAVTGANGIGVSGSPITSSGTIGLSLGAITPSSVNGLTITSSTGTLTIANGTTLTSSNTLTFTGTNGSSVNFGGGGTVLYSGGSYVSSITGTAGQVTASASTGAVTLSLPSALTGIQSITGLAGNMTITAGTGNSRTMALQTTTSGGIATTFLTGNADQSANFAAGLTVAGNLTFGTSSSTLNGATGSVGITAVGTAQNIYFTPSTTGGVVAYNASGTSRLAQILTLNQQATGSGTEVASLAFNLSTSGEAAGAKGGIGFSRTASFGRGDIMFFQNNVADTTTFTTSTVPMILTRTGNLLIGGAGTDMTGRLQINTHTTTAGGISMGSSSNTYLYLSGVDTFNIATANAIAVTVDSSQNITPVAGNILRFASTKGIQGSNTNDNVAAGYVGENVSSLVAIGSPQSLTNNTAANITSISLTAGDWDVYALPSVAETTSTVTARTAGISTTTATLPSDGSEGYNGTQSVVTSETNSIPVTRVRLSLSGTTTVYLVVKVTFSAGTAGGFGSLNARRDR